MVVDVLSNPEYWDMSQLQSQVSLLPYNTFGIDVNARYWIALHSAKEAKEFLMDNIHNSLPIFILGGGSNILFTQDFEGVMIKNEIKGKEIIRETDEHIWLRVGAGENWHELVLFCLENNWGGIENLSLIPGNVGASPIQNIGAYGVEIKDVFHELEAIHLQTAHLRTFSHAECQFGYRDSIFKRSAKGLYMITHVTFRLTKEKHNLNISYGAIPSRLEALGLEPTIHSISSVVIEIRQSKLPDPKVIGNGGSFFKNPVVARPHFERIQEAYPKMPFYKQEDGQIKIPAGWLIQTAGWKGKMLGNYGVHDKQALVLVNKGGASGKDIYELSEQILQDIKTRFGIELMREVNVL